MQRSRNKTAKPLKKQITYLGLGNQISSINWKSNRPINVKSYKEKQQQPSDLSCKFLSLAVHEGKLQIQILTWANGQNLMLYNRSTSPFNGGFSDPLE